MTAPYPHQFAFIPHAVDLLINTYIHSESKDKSLLVPDATAYGGMHVHDQLLRQLTSKESWIELSVTDRRMKGVLNELLKHIFSIVMHDHSLEVGGQRQQTRAKVEPLLRCITRGVYNC